MGAFLYVTSHFIVMPLAALGFAVWTVIRKSHEHGLKRKALGLASLLIPAAIILVAVSGDPGLARYLGPS